MKYPSFVALLCLSFAFAASQAAEPHAIKIGVQIPLTGERAAVGRLMRNGVHMAADAINSRADDNGISVELVLQDDGSRADGALKSAQALAGDAQILAILGEINSPLVLAGAPVIDEAGVPYLTAGSSPRTTAASKWIFRAGAGDSLMADLLTRYLVENLHVKSYAILHDKTGIHNQRSDAIAALLSERYGLKALVNGKWSPGDTEFRPALKQIEEQHPMVLLAFGESQEGPTFLKQATALHMETQIVTQRDFGVQRVLDLAGPAGEGMMVITEYAPELQGSATQAWNVEYGKRFGGGANVIAAQYYDALMLVAEAAKTGGASRIGIQSGLRQLKGYPGIVGDYTFDASRNGVHRFFIARVISGKLSRVTVLEENPRQ